jgi:beta-lactamase class A
VSSSAPVKPADSKLAANVPASSLGRTSRKETSPVSARRTRRFVIPTGALVLIQFGILGVGLAAIGGTLLGTLGPGHYDPKTLKQMAQSWPNWASAPSKTQTTPSASVSPSKDSAPPHSLQIAPLAPAGEITALKQKIQAVVAKSAKELTLGLFLLNLDTNQVVDVGGIQPFSAASTIKIPVLVAFFQDVDAGKIRLDEKLTMRPDLIASGSGGLQYENAGNQYSALEVATEMIRTSDNTATNMLIDRLGGKEALNQRFQAWGLQHTVIKNSLPDLEGTNLTSPQDLTNLLAYLAQGELVSRRSRDRILDIMQTPITRTLLPQSIEPSATIAHKTGDIGTSVGDAGLIDMPNGKRYAITALVKRPFNDDRAQELIRQAARTAYVHLKYTTPPPPSVQVQVSPSQSPNSPASDSTAR